MAFRDYAAELVGTIPHLPYPLACKLVNRAWKNIRDMRLWSWLVSYGDILVPVLISTGTVTATFGSTTVTCDSSASAALLPTITANPPLASTTLGQGRQIRIGAETGNRPLYSIVSVDSAVPAALVLTLDRVYGGTGGASQAYQVYKAYFAPPSTDFLRYFSVTNMTSGYTITGKKLYYTQAKLNSVDPQRGGTGNAYIISAFRPDTLGRPVHEWYPHPVNAALYNCLYQRRGTDLSDTVDIPATFSESCLISLALVHGASWAVANANTYPELAQTNWVLYAQDKRATFKEELIQAIKQDDEISPLVPFLQGLNRDFPLGGEFAQSHDLTSMLGGL